MDRSHKPPAIGVSRSIPQPTVDVSDKQVDARLPTGESVSVRLYGATVTSWKLADGEEQLFVSSQAVLDGSKAIRGGIPVVFPVFGAPPSDHATSKLPQHGFARTATWAFLGKSTSESDGGTAVKLDFGLSTEMLKEDVRAAWPYQFGLLYSVILSPDALEISLQVQNKGNERFEFHVLLHNYFTVPDVNKIRIKNLQSKSYSDKTDNFALKEETSSAIAVTGETDRVYLDVDPATPVSVVDAETDKPRLSIVRQGLNTVTVWNPWSEKAKGMADLADDEYTRMVCVEPGAVKEFQALDAGETWEGSQIIRARQ
ncbi:hypothetical protein VTN31DRAFT_2952 [Thermomyces dupontii]|uniref:uncharacterized protein n=1 Tax=Talaromyces thermophilus TaxID=28565 RepID=UPI00374307CF